MIQKKKLNDGSVRQSAKLIYIYDIEDQNGMTRIHDKKVNNIAEFSLLHDIVNPVKHTKRLNNNYCPIIYEFMNNRKGKQKFNNFRILLDSGCSSMIVMGGLVLKIFLKRCCDALAHKSW